MADIVDMVFAQLQTELADLRQSQRDMARQLQDQGFGKALRSYTVATLPAGYSEPALAWASNGRKSGEGAGAGTGVPAYFNPATNTWFRFSDDTQVAS